MKKFVKYICIVFLLLNSLVIKDISAKENKEELTIGIVQLVSHPSLNDIYNGIIDELKNNGYIEGENLTIYTYNAEGDMTVLNNLSKQVVNKKPDYIFAITTPVALSLQNTTQDIPIILAGITDPLSSKLVDSLDEPNGNISGISDAIPVDEQLKLIKKLTPNVKKIGFIYSTSEDNSEQEIKEAINKAKSMNYETEVMALSSTLDMERVAKNLVSKVDAIYVGSDNSVASSFEILAKVANAKKIPIYTPVKSMIDQGAFAGVAIDQKDIGIKAVEFMMNLKKNNLNISQVPVEFIKDTKTIKNEEVAKTITVNKSINNQSFHNFLNNSIYINAIGQGLIWGILGIGLFITFRIMKFADLTSEASFTMGAVTSVSLITNGVNIFLAMFLSLITGMICGLVTGLLMTQLKIPGLLAGIITMTGLYSVNLKILGKPNLSLKGYSSIFSIFKLQNIGNSILTILISLAIVLVIIFILNNFLKTDLGLSLIATGDNEEMAKSFSIPTQVVKCLALMLANGLIALCGSLIAQNSGFADVSMGIGTVVIGLSSIVIGEVIVPKEVTLTKRLALIILGSVIYQLLLAFVLNLGLNPNYYKLLSALILIVFLYISRFKTKKGER